MNAKLEATWRCPYCINRKIHPCPHTAENWRRECYDSAAPTTGTTTKTTRELLELAAKAAGYELHTYHDSEEDERLNPEWRITCTIDGFGKPCEPWHKLWNPRDDDGDSRRLEVKLRMTVQTTDREATAYCDELPSGTNWVTVQITESVGDLAATRLAVLRAAAAIGEAMP